VTINAQRTKPLPVQSSRHTTFEVTASLHFSAVGRPFGGDYWQGAERNAREENSFRVHDVPPGVYTVDVLASSEWYVASAQSGDTDLLRENLTVSSGTPTPAIDIELRDDGATLTGTVSNPADGQHTRGSVIAVPDGNPRGSKMTSAGPDGSFRFENLAPGGYTVLAIDKADGVEYANRDVITPYLSAGSHVDLSANQESKVALNLAPTGK
jgi:hypothetical protein